MGAKVTKMTEMYPWEVLTKIDLDSGVELWVRPVPPYATQDVHAKLPAPPRPQVTLKGAAGNEEVVNALPGSPEYEEYRDKHEQHRKDITAALTNFELDYAVVKWKYPGDEKFHSQPPKSWAVPSLEKWQVEYSDRRIAFIKMCLIQTLGDQEAIEKVMLGNFPISLEDIKAAMVPTTSPEAENH